MSSFLDNQPKFSIKPTLDALSASLRQDSQGKMDNDDLRSMYRRIMSEHHIENTVHFILHAIISFFFLLMVFQLSNSYYFFATATLTFREMNSFFFCVYDKTIMTSRELLIRVIMLGIVRIIRRIEAIYWISKLVMYHACVIPVFGTPLFFCSWWQDEAPDSSAESLWVHFGWPASLGFISFVIARSLSYSYLFARLKSIGVLVAVREQLDKEDDLEGTVEA